MDNTGSGGYRNILFVVRPDDMRSLALIVEETKQAIREMGGGPDIHIACQPFDGLLIMEAEKRVGRPIGLVIINAPQVEVKPELNFIRDIHKENKNTRTIVIGWMIDESKFASRADRFIRKEEVFKLGGADLRMVKDAVKGVLGALKLNETVLQVKERVRSEGPRGRNPKGNIVTAH